MIRFVLCVCCVSNNASSFVAIVDVFVANVIAAIIDFDADFPGLVISVNDTSVVVPAISADFVSLTLVIDVIVVGVSVAFVIDVIANIIFDIRVIVIIITFVVIDFTVIISDIHVLVVVDFIIGMAVVVIIVIVVTIASFVVNEMVVDTGIVISMNSTVFFLFSSCQKLVQFLFFDRYM